MKRKNPGIMTKKNGIVFYLFKLLVDFVKDTN